MAPPFSTSTSSSSANKATTATEMPVEKSALPPAKVRVVPNDKLYVSEPNPRWFGNGPNPRPGSSEASAWTNDNWLKSRFHFSFAEYSSQHNRDYGVLRVMNDDLVQPRRGFGEHGHSNMEIVTYVVHGKLTHQDSMGTPKESLGRGSIQYMTAGSGVHHSEFNHGDKPLRFIQTWIKPSGYGLDPKYGSSNGADCVEGRTNKLQHLVSDSRRRQDGPTAPVQVSQDVDAYATELSLGKKVEHELLAGRQAYLLCIEGEVKVNGKLLSKYDASEIASGDDSAASLDIEAVGVEPTENGDVAHVLMFTMKKVPGSGRTDW